MFCVTSVSSPPLSASAVSNRARAKWAALGLAGDQIAATRIVKRMHFQRIAGERLGRGQLHRIEPRPDAGSILVAERAKAALGGDAGARDYENPHAHPLPLGAW